MAQHGYLREYDEAPGSGDDRDRGDWRERTEGSWQGRDEDYRRDRDWRGRDEDRNRNWDEHGRNREFMFGDSDRNRDRGRGEGFFSRMKDDARSWFGEDDDSNRRNERGAWENNRDWPQRDRGSSGGYGRQQGFGGSQEDYRGGRQQGGQRDFSSHPDDHYRSWRDRQMQSLDRDYADYCREREQQFHRDFDSWRQNRQQPGSQGQQSAFSSQGGAQNATAQQSGQQGNASSNSETMELTEPARESGETQGVSSPTGAATLGTNNSENSGTGRGRR